jgi:hypothetical protein
MGELERFTSTALRRPKKGIFEQSLCQHLALAVASKPLRKIRFICEAAYLLDDEGRKGLGVDEEELEVVYRVALSFLNSHRSSLRWEGMHHYYWSLAWSFDTSLHRARESYERYVNPWLRDRNLSFYEIFMGEHRANELTYVRDVLDHPDEELSEEGLFACHARGFFIVTEYLAESSYSMFESQFVAWALPRAQRIFTCLSDLVDPRLFSDMLQAAGRGERVADHVGEGQRADQL